MHVMTALTYLHREAWWEPQGDEVPQFSKVSVWDGHEVDDGRHLLSQGQRVCLTQPKRGFKPGKKKKKTDNVVW